MGTTPKGYPYPEGTDLVVNGDDAIKALALAIDDKMPTAIAAGSVKAVGIKPGNKVTVAVTFPAGLFHAAPYVTTGLNSSVIAERFTSHSSKTATSMQVGGGYTGQSTSIDMTINWIAMLISAPTSLQTLADEVVDDATATCSTAGCPNQGIPIPIASTWVDEETGETGRVDQVVCGVCGADITATAQETDDA